MLRRMCYYGGQGGKVGEAPLFLLAEQMAFSGNATGEMKLFKELYHAVRNRLCY